MSTDARRWGAAETRAFRDLARYAVPERERQTAVIVELVRAAAVDGDVVELGCGEGVLTAALLEGLVGTRVHALDGSAEMLAATRAAAPDPTRLVTRAVDLADDDWRRFETPVRAVVSSLAIHHLGDAAKRRLFADLHAALAPGGVFVLADVIRPASAVGHELAARMWDAEVERRALALDGHRGGLDAFRRADWNHFRHAELDPIDRPATVVELLDWLAAAGFAAVDLHWMMAGHVIVSGWHLPATSGDRPKRP